MDNTIQGYKSAANDASANLNELQTSAPTMLAELKKNLVGIFAKDNPIIQARDTALTDYLNSPSNTRASILPDGMPQVEGSALTLSPTQQNAIVTARQNAALVPLFGLNELIKGQYGTIGDIVQGAGTAYASTIDAAKARVSTLLDLYKTAVAEQEAKTKASNSGGLDLPALIAAVRASLGTGVANNRPPLEAFDTPDELVVPDLVTGQPTALNINIPPVPKNTSNFSQPLTGLNLPGNLNLAGYDFSKLFSGGSGNTGINLVDSGRSPFANLGINLGGSPYGF